MRAEDKGLVGVGSIIQCGPEETSSTFALGVIERLESWGAYVRIPGRGEIRLAWSLFEPTGGVILWNQNGTKFRAPEAPARHHP